MGNSSDHVAPQKPERKMSVDERRKMARQSSDDDNGDDEELESDQRSPSYSLKGLLMRDSVLDGIKDDKNTDENDMSNKRNRSKLHFLMYMTKMSVDMDILFQKAREGETPRSP